MVLPVPDLRRRLPEVNTSTVNRSKAAMVVEAWCRLRLRTNGSPLPVVPENSTATPFAARELVPNRQGWHQVQLGRPRSGEWEMLVFLACKVELSAMCSQAQLLLLLLLLEIALACLVYWEFASAQEQGCGSVPATRWGWCLLRAVRHALET